MGSEHQFGELLLERLYEISQEGKHDLFIVYGKIIKKKRENKNTQSLLSYGVQLNVH